MLDIDSGGGEVAGLQELADFLLAARSVKPIWAIANTRAASAAYWLASLAEHVVIAPHGAVGSIGVLVQHQDVSKAMDKRGVVTSFVFAGKHKVDGNPFEPLADEVRADLQQSVDRIYTDFVDAVASARRIDPAIVRGTEGRMLDPEQAVDAGLADAVGTYGADVSGARRRDPTASLRARRFRGHAMSLEVRLDGREFEERLNFASRETVNACRRAVDRSARTARREAIVALEKDIGVKKSVWSKAVPLVKGSTAGSLTATWTVSKARVLIALTSGVRLPVRGASGLQASTFRETGGKSAALSAPKAFTINVGGQKIVMVRRGKGRAAIRPIYAESPVAGLSQDDGAPRKVWTAAAGRELAVQLPTELAKVFAGQSAGPTNGGGE